MVGSHSWEPGDMFLPDDFAGKGHTSRVIRGPVRILFVPLDAHFDVSTWQSSESLEKNDFKHAN